MLKTIVVDDEPLARKGMVNYIQQTGMLELTAACENAFEAKEALAEQAVDLILLDIEMPRQSSIEFLKSLQQNPLVILVTAYSEFAAEGFELDVVDYLVKPVPYQRFVKAIEKAADLHRYLQEKKTAGITEYIFVKCNRQIEKVNLADILYVEALHNYVAIYTENKKLITYQSLKQIEQLLPPSHFLRIQKSFIVAVSKVTAIADGKIEINSQLLPVSRSLKTKVMEHVLKRSVKW
jgi:DNA-binding LytR/AlgR family response regulator